MANSQVATWVQEDPRIVASERVVDILSLAGIFFYFYFYFIWRGIGLHVG